MYVGSHTSLFTNACSKTKLVPFCKFASKPPAIFMSPVKYASSRATSCAFSSIQTTPASFCTIFSTSLCGLNSGFGSKSKTKTSWPRKRSWRGFTNWHARRNISIPGSSFSPLAAHTVAAPAERWAEPVELLSFRPLCVFFVKAKMPVVQGRELSLDEQVLHVGGQFERVAVGHDDVGEFALLERAYLIRKAENLRRVKCDGLERFFMRQSVRHGVRGVLAQPPLEGIVEAREAELHSCGGKLRRLRKQPVLRIVLLNRQHQHRP